MPGPDRLAPRVAIHEDIMTLLKTALVALALLASAMAASLPASAGSSDPLFINLLSDETNRAGMALSFGKNQQERGHPLSVFFNQRAVLIVTKGQAEKFAAQQKLIADLVAKGATMFACRMCMQNLGVKEDDLIPGVKMGNPDSVGEALFRDNTKTMTW
jgi:predicted peroxiredoxin